MVTFDFLLLLSLLFLTFPYHFFIFNLLKKLTNNVYYTLLVCFCTQNWQSLHKTPRPIYMGFDANVPPSLPSFVGFIDVPVCGLFLCHVIILQNFYGSKSGNNGGEWLSVDPDTGDLMVFTDSDTRGGFGFLKLSPVQ